MIDFNSLEYNRLRFSRGVTYDQNNVASVDSPLITCSMPVDLTMIARIVENSHDDIKIGDMIWENMRVIVSLRDAHEMDLSISDGNFVDDEFLEENIEIHLRALGKHLNTQLSKYYV